MHGPRAEIFDALSTCAEGPVRPHPNRLSRDEVRVLLSRPLFLLSFPLLSHHTRALLRFIPSFSFLILCFSFFCSFCAKMWSQHYAKYQYVLSPPGHGLDCHRTWEAMLLGAIPIVVDRSYRRSGYHLIPVLPSRRNDVDSSTSTSGSHRNGPDPPPNNGLFRQGLFDGLPVLVLHDWSEVCNVTLLAERGKELRKKLDDVPQRLSLRRWIEREERALAAEEER